MSLAERPFGLLSFTGPRSIMRKTIQFLLIGFLATIAFALGRKVHLSADTIEIINSDGSEAIIRYEDARTPDIIECYVESVIVRDTIHVERVVERRRVDTVFVRIPVPSVDTVYVRQGLSSTQVSFSQPVTAHTVAGFLQAEKQAPCFDAFISARQYSNTDSYYVEVASPDRHDRGGCSFQKVLDANPRKNATEWGQWLVKEAKSGRAPLVAGLWRGGGEVIITYPYGGSIRLGLDHLINKYEPVQ